MRAGGLTKKEKKRTKTGTILSTVPIFISSYSRLFSCIFVIVRHQSYLFLNMHALQKPSHHCIGSGLFSGCCSSCSVTTMTPPSSFSIDSILANRAGSLQSPPLNATGARHHPYMHPPFPHHPHPAFTTLLPPEYHLGKFK